MSNSSSSATPISTTKGPLDPGAFARALRDIALEAGAVIMPHFHSEGMEVREKADDSPVTEADEAAEAHILKALKALVPDIPVIAEEAVAGGAVPKAADRFILVDPLDGTKEFISGRGEFTVNIALVEKGLPTVGAVYAPALSRMFYGAQGAGAFEERIRVDGTVDAPAKAISARHPPEAGLTAVASRSHRDEKTDAYLKQFKVASFVSAGSSLKFCLVAAGEADIYPRHGRTMEWDTAAGHAVLAAAGGTVSTFEGPPLTYGKADMDFANPFFVAKGGA